jgi:3-hydroxyisobutyrate dehydrogenase
MLPNIAKGQQSTSFALALQIKDINQAMLLGDDRGVPMPIASVVHDLLQIGLNTLGKNARLEQMIGVIESMAGTRFVGRGALT